ncbi:MAG: hypothetical protein Crog4KO_29420 [Crocinitomicaceae bacterium]
MVRINLLLATLLLLSSTNTSFSQDDAKLPSIETKWQENWKVNIGLTCYRTNMLLHNGDLLIGSNGSDWNKKMDSLDGLYVINPKTGEVKHHIQHQAIGDNDVNGLAVNNNGTLFFGGDMQYVYAFETETYTEIWKYHVGGDLESTPGVADLNNDGIEDAIFVTQRKGVIALDGLTGALLWKGEPYTHGGNMSPAIFDLNNDGVKDVVASGGSSFALNGKDGTTLWEHDQNSGMHASPLIIENNKGVRVYTVASYGSCDVYQPDGTKINGVGLTYGMFSSPVPNGQGYAAEGISWNNGSGVLTYSCDTDNWVKEEDSRFIGNVMDIESNRIDGEKVSASAISVDVDSDGKVEFLIPSESGILYITEPSEQKTEKFVLPAGAEATLFICDYDKNGRQTIFFAGLDGYLRSYEIGKTGTVVWPGLRGPSHNGVLSE